MRANRTRCFSNPAFLVAGKAGLKTNLCGLPIKKTFKNIILAGLAGLAGTFLLNVRKEFSYMHATEQLG